MGLCRRIHSVFANCEHASWSSVCGAKHHCWCPYGCCPAGVTMPRRTHQTVLAQPPFASGCCCCCCCCCDVCSFLKMAAEYKKKVGFKGTLLLEPKPQVRAHSSVTHAVNILRQCSVRRTSGI